MYRYVYYIYIYVYTYVFMNLQVRDSRVRGFTSKGSAHAQATHMYIYM